MTFESQTHEFKLSVSEWREITESIAAFATTRGGIVEIGISPDGRRVGQQIGDETLTNLANRIKQNTDPPQYPSITVEGEANNAVIVLHITESPIKPVWAFGRPLKRVGASNQRLTREETTWLAEQTTGRTWDALPNESFIEEEIDPAVIRNFLRRIDFDREMKPHELLMRLRLITKNDALTHAAALLFASEPYLFVPGAQLKCGRFLGTASVTFLDEQTITGNVLAQFDEAINFITRNTRQGIRIGQAERQRLSEYPDEAVRETLINAICHRNYADPGTIQVRIYDDRMEVWNPGRLPFDLTIEQLFEEHASRPRNVLLADVFFRLRLIERWGTGTNRIIDACKVHGLTPTFREAMGNFIVAIPTHSLFIPVPESISLSERQQQAIEYVYKHRSITNGIYKSLCSVSKSTATNDLNLLVRAKLLIRSGSARAISYTLPVANAPAIDE